MKKFLSAVLSAALIVFAFPVGASAASSGDQIIDMHGTRTYIGLSSDWSKTWVESRFTDVTNEDVPPQDGSVTMKAGTVDDIRMNGSGSKLTVKGGTVKDIRSEGSVEISGGTVYSVNAEEDVKLNKATVRRDVKCGGELTASGTVAVGGSITAEDVTIGSGVTLNVSGDLTCTRDFELNGGSVKADEINGDDTGTLVINKYSGVLPDFSQMASIRVKSGTSVSSNGKLTVDQLILEQKADFTAASTLEVGTLTGPGTLSVHSGRLTIHDGVEGEPLLVFSDVVNKGTVAFRADENAVQEDDVQLYDYSLNRKNVGSMDEFILTSGLSDGITLDHSSIWLEKGRSASVKAQVKPALSKFAAGTKIVWELHGDTDAFTSSVDSSAQTCTVTCTKDASAKSRATLSAYLVDSRSDRLTDYRSDSCVFSVGTAGLVCDTTGTYTFGANNLYYYKITTTEVTAPSAVSSNPAAVSVAFDKSLPDGYLYRITNAGSGTAVITTTSAGGTSVSFVAMGTGSGVVSDTPYRFTMKAGATYQFKFTVPSSGTYGFASGNNAVARTVSTVRSGNAYYYKIRAVKPGVVGIYGQQTGKSGTRQAIVTVQ